MKRFIIAAFSASLIVLFLAACEQPLGLGPRISIKGPQLKVTSPTPVSGQTDIAVSDLFMLAGTAVTSNTVARMEIKLQYYDNISGVTTNAYGRQWQYTNGWYFRRFENEQWKFYSVSDYGYRIDANIRVEPPYWQVSGNTVNWGLPILMDELEKGDYFITISAWDNAGNSDAGSTLKIKVTYDNNEPNFNVRSPSLIQGTVSPRNPDYPRIGNTDNYLFDSYIYDPINNPEGTYNDIDKWINSPVEFSWEIDRDMIGSYELNFQFTNRHNLDSPNQRVSYYSYNWDFINGPKPPNYGIFTDRNDISGLYTKIGSAMYFNVPPAQQSGGNVYIEVPAGDKRPGKSYVPVQVVSRLKSITTGAEQYASKGWFAYNPDSDKPWANIAFGYKADPNNVPLDAAERGYVWKDQQGLYIYGYDDDEVKSIEWKLYRLQDGSLDTATLVDSGIKNSTGLKKDFLTLSAGYDLARYKMIVQVTDINGTVGPEYWSFFTVEGNYTPTVRTIIEPSTTVTLFGGNNYNGDFTIRGRAQIEDTNPNVNADTLKVDRVSVVWLKSAPDPNVNDDKYNRNDPDWDRGRDNPGPNGYYEVPGRGDRVWEVPGAQITKIASSNGNNNNGLNNGSGQEEYEFTLNLNLFTHLNIGRREDGKNPLDNQYFLFRVLSVQNPSNKSSVYTQYGPTLGDIDRPKLTFTRIVITKTDGYGNNVDGSPFTYNNSGSGFSMLTTIVKRTDGALADQRNTHIRIEGEWTDDSITAWRNLGDTVLREKFGGFRFIWKGDDREINMANAGFGFTGTGAARKGTWYAEHDFQESNDSPVITLTAAISDTIGEAVSAPESVLTETSNPTLYRIFSSTSDGIYGANKDTVLGESGTRYIEINLDFNKPVFFFSTNLSSPPNTGSDRAPYLVLNNGGEAYYYEGNGGYRITFRYYVNGVNSGGLPTPSTGAQGGTSTGLNGEGERLHVKRIEWGTYTQDKWLSMETGTTRAAFPPAGTSVFDYDYNYSLAKMNNIVIDKEAPGVSNVTTAADDSKPHGAGSSIYITLNFNERVQIDGAAANNFYLVLGGGNLAGNNARAVFDTAGPTSATFRYDVGNNHDTSASTYTGNSRFLSITSLYRTGVDVKDMAGNDLVNPASLNLPKNLVIDTNPPAPPDVSAIIAKRYYNTTTFTISGLEADGRAEYCENYDPLNPNGAIWNVASKSAGSTTATFTLSLNGNYQIAARQWDNATEPNVSNAAIVSGDVIIDNDAIISNVSSSNTDGIYGEGQIIEIEMTSRIPLAASGPLNTAIVTLNVEGPGRSALLIGSKNGSNNTVWVFRYTVPADVYVMQLGIVEIDFGQVTFRDTAAVNPTDLTAKIYANADALKNGFIAQKSIRIMTGNPNVTNRNMGSGITFAGDILTINFDRDIYRGDTIGKLIIKQVEANYRIPAVLTVSRWNELFVGRSDLNGVIDSYMPAWSPPTGYAGGAAGYWRWVGDQLYEKGSNGALNNTFTPDTTVKYVLKFSVNPAAVGTSQIPILNNLTMFYLRTMFREAEALRFGARDGEVSIINNNRTVRVDLTGAKKFPVLGADYQWTFPNGFVKDFLGKPNTSASTSYIDSTASGTLVLNKPGIEAPVIRIDKGEDGETFMNTGNYAGYNRQALQPLQSRVRIDCRTPGTSLHYQMRQSTDNVGRLIWRANPGVIPNRLPNLGNQVAGDYASFNNAMDRPQSGYYYAADRPNANWATNGLNLWTGLPAWQAEVEYSDDFPIGTTNYNDGGMIIQIQARSRTGTATYSPYSYESAYRSVLVYNNIPGLNGNGHAEDVSVTNRGNPNNVGLGFAVPELGRIWVRGGDATNGEPTVPDFPIARDRSLHRKIRLLTPIDINDRLNNDTTLNQATNANIPNAWIADSYSSYSAMAYTANGNALENVIGHGQYLWFWVTWRLNVNAYIDLYAGQLPEDEAALQSPVMDKGFYKAYIMAKAHFPVIPGRTTLLETRTGFNNYVDGGHGELEMGAVANVPAQRD